MIRSIQFRIFNCHFSISILAVEVLRLRHGWVLCDVSVNNRLALYNTRLLQVPCCCAGTRSVRSLCRSEAPS